MKKYELEVLSEDTIKNKIYNIRGVQVMLDRDLAGFYNVETKVFNQAIKRNLDLFPNDFMFELSKNEFAILRSQFVTSSWGGTRYMPKVFTEQGIAMLAGVLKSQIAKQINIKIIRAFVEMRKFLYLNVLISQRLDNVEKKQLEQDLKFDKIFNALESKENLPKQGIFFDGQVFDAYKFVSDLIRKAEKSIIVIDNFVDERLFALLSKRKQNVKATIWTKNITTTLLIDLKKYNTQYPMIEIKEFAKAHDRFLILDERDVYLIGSSLKDLGTKWFGFSKIEIDTFKLINQIKEVGN